MLFVITQVLELHCKELHTYLSGSRVCSISNSSDFIAMLMKAVCFFSPEPDCSDSSTVTTRNRGNIDDTKLSQSATLSYKQSRIRPISVSTNSKVHSKLFKQNTFPLLRSPISGLKQLYPLSCDTIDGESSGYEGDTEFWTQQWWKGEERYNQEEENEEGLAAGAGSSNRLKPVSPIRTPTEMKRKIWLESPIWQSIELLKECLEDRDSAEKWLVSINGCTAVL